jgi:cell division protein FtsB
MANRTYGKITGEQLIETGKRFLTFLVAVYLIFLLGRAVYQNYLVRERIANIEESIEALKAQNKRLENLIAYYQTETFRELEARSKLGLKKPGETVVALPENSDEEAPSGPSPVRTQGEFEKPNYIKWWEYLFGES